MLQSSPDTAGGVVFGKAVELDGMRHEVCAVVAGVSVAAEEDTPADISVEAEVEENAGVDDSVAAEEVDTPAEISVGGEVDVDAVEHSVDAC